VKPANVLITEEGRPKLTDFGMARLASHDKKDTPLLGTPAYWSPEQIFGRAQDARSDIFSLGVVLYEMITGISPFKGDSINAVCNNILSSTPRSLSHINGSIPTSLSDLVTVCLAKDPANRINSAEALAQQLFPYARQKPIAQNAPATAPTLRNRAARLLRSA
jgi:serine/threonine-protein kinase